MNRRFVDHATSEVISMPYWFGILAVFFLTGCTQNPGTNTSQIQSEREFYYQQNVIRPDGSEPNVTPYGPPANAADSSEYDRWIRPDSVSRYPGLE